MAQITHNELELETVAKLDELFGDKHSLTEFNPGKVVLPHGFKELGDDILNFKIREDDVWVVSYPRSGSTWTQEMIWLLMNNMDYTKAKMPQFMRTPLLEMTAIMRNQPDYFRLLGSSVHRADNYPSPRVIKSHLPLELLPKAFDSASPKIVYIARDPKDTCVSFYHCCKLIDDMKGTLEEFADLFLKGRTPYGPTWNHILGFWKRRNDPNILFLKYEDMIKDLNGVIKKAAAFLNKEISDEDVEKMEIYLSFSQMKANPAVNFEAVISSIRGPEHLENSDNAFIRKGEIGDHKNIMNPDLIAQFDSSTAQHLKEHGLSFD